MKFKLPEYDSTEEIKTQSLSALVKIDYEPVGRWFEACLKRQSSDFSVSVAEEQKDEEDEVVVKEVLTPDDKIFMAGLDAKEWKFQDHYRVLGITHLRHTATDDDVKNAYRAKVLKYHPDKKSSLDHGIIGLNLAEYFTCITHAYEALSTFEGRRLVDSVDTTFDDTIPTANEAAKNDFYETFTEVFKRNSGWSKKQPVPPLGNAKTPIEDVLALYEFWYDDFSSWRDFKYLMEEDEDKAENREERRWMERQNRQKRQKRKKDEITRIRTLVDLAHQHDPRLKAYREEEKAKKAEEKRLKEEQKKKEEDERKEAIRKQKEEEERLEQEAKEKQQKEKKEKDKKKKAITKDRQSIRKFLKEKDYFNSEEDVEARINRLEKCLENLTAEQTQVMKLLAKQETAEEFHKLYLERSDEVFSEIQRKKEEIEREAEAARAERQAKANANVTDQNWNDLEIQLLVKATTMFAIGTQNRWETIADYVNEHSDSDKKKTGKHVITKVKKLQKLDPTQREEVNKRAFESSMKTTAKKLDKVPDITDISLKDKVNSELLENKINNNEATKDKLPETKDKQPDKQPAKKDKQPATEDKVTAVKDTQPATEDAAIGEPAQPATEKGVWAPAEQKLLEEALKKFDSKAAERWEKIAGHVGTKTKKECMKRYKELVEKIKAAKAAKAATS